MAPAMTSCLRWPCLAAPGGSFGVAVVLSTLYPRVCVGGWWGGGAGLSDLVLPDCAGGMLSDRALPGCAGGVVAAAALSSLIWSCLAAPDGWWWRQ